MINVVNDRLQVENPPNGWPITAESGWQEYHNKVDQTFEEIVADLANTRFNKTVFEGTATPQAFEWDIAMETYWPAHYGRFRESWTAGAQAQGTWRSRRKITWPEWQKDVQTLPHSQPIGLMQSAYVTCLCVVTAPNWCSSNIGSCMNDKMRLHHLACICTDSVSYWKIPLYRATSTQSFFFCCERLSASMARSLHLSFICIPQSTRALDQGGGRPRHSH